VCVWSYLANTLELWIEPGSDEINACDSMWFSFPMSPATMVGDRPASKDADEFRTVQSRTICSNCKKAAVNYRFGRLLCVKELCDRVWTTHLYLHDNDDESHERYSIATDLTRESLPVEVETGRKLERNFWSEAPDKVYFDIILAPNILMKLPQQDMNTNSSLEFCSHALNGHTVRHLSRISARMITCYGPDEWLGSELAEDTDFGPESD
jgi:hypothetical protein